MTEGPLAASLGIRHYWFCFVWPWLGAIVALISGPWRTVLKILIADDHDLLLDTVTAFVDATGTCILYPFDAPHELPNV